MSARIEARGLGIRFDFDRQGRVVTPVLRTLRRKGETVWGLRDVDVSIQPGEGVALVGPSGSGKTSLLRAFAGVLPADEGSLKISGKVGSMLAVEGGLLGALTGKENAETLSVLAGLSLAGAKSEEERLVATGRLGRAMDRPVSTYSAGMRARLGFAIAESADPEVILLDEVFEALDHDYREVVRKHAVNLLGRGGIVVIAGHDHLALRKICSRAIRMEGGRVTEDGPIEMIL